jgi:hypothetical protein
MQCHVWCCSCCCRATCGVAGIVPHAVSRASHHMWCRGCCTACGVVGITPHVVSQELHRVVLQTLHSMWCHGRCTACGVAGIAPRGVTGIAPHGVAGIVPCGATGVAPCVESRSWSLRHGVVVMVAVVVPHCVAVMRRVVPQSRSPLSWSSWSEVGPW